MALPGAARAAAARAISSLALGSSADFASNPGSCVLASTTGPPAVDLLDEALTGQRVQVPADRHVGDVQLAGQLVDPDPAAPAHLVEDQRTALLREQVLILAQRRARSFLSRTVRSGLRDTLILPRTHVRRVTWEIP